MTFKLVNLTLPVEQSNDPNLLIDIGIMLGETWLPIQIRIFPGSIGGIFGEKIWSFKIYKLKDVDG
jgi:hypothetical protein